MIKKYGGYVLTVILSMIVGITGTYFIMKNNIQYQYLIWKESIIDETI